MRRAYASQLVLMRHGQSTYNAENRFTGRAEAELTPWGREQAVEAARQLKAAGFRPCHAFSSNQGRAVESCRLALRELRSDLSPTPLATLDERDYGELTGLDKAQAVRRWGEAQVAQWRRSYAIAPPGGESLRDVCARVARAYLHSILPAALSGENCLVVAHGNSLRAMMALIEDLSPDRVEAIEILPGALQTFSVASNSVAHRSSLSQRPQERDPILDAIDDQLRVEHGDLDLRSLLKDASAEGR